MDADPSLIINACRARRERRRTDMINAAMVTANLIIGHFAEGYRPLDAVKHLYTAEEFDEIERQDEERRQYIIEAQQIERIRRLML